MKPAFKTRDQVEAEAAAAEQSRTQAINRFAWAVRDLRALGLAGRWNLRMSDGAHTAAISIDFNDDARAKQADDAIWGDMK